MQAGLNLTLSETIKTGYVTLRPTLYFVINLATSWYLIHITYGASKMHLSLRLPSLLRQWFCCCWFIVLYPSHYLWGLCIGLCFGMHYFVSFIVLQSSWWGKESWLLCNNCLSYVLLLFIFCGSSLWCRAVRDCGIFWSYSLTFILVKHTCAACNC